MDTEPNDSAPGGEFSPVSRVLAGLMLLGALAVMYVSADILSGGAITRALSGRTAPEGDDDDR